MGFLARYLLPLTLSGALLTGCATNPVTGKSEVSLVSAQQEVAIGSKNYGPSQQSQGGRYTVDPELQVYISQVGNKLAAVSDRPNLPYEFVVLNNPVPNAWAMPGGKIAVNRGLLTMLEDESQLAAVLSHEIVHAAARHGASKMTRGTLLNLGMAALGTAASSAGYGGINQFTQIGAAAWMAKYGREDEMESDAYGMDYMARAGYSPEGAVKLQEMFVRMSKGRSMSSLFASHPPSQARVTANKQKAKTLPPGATNRTRYQVNIAQLKHDAPAYKAQELAIKSLRAKNPKAALAQINRAIAIQPNDGSFWELKGHALAMLKQVNTANTAFTSAIRKNPEYFSHYLARGMLRFEHGNPNGAQMDLEKSYQLLPTPNASYYLGELALAKGDQRRGIHFLQQAAGSKSPIAKRAQARLAQLGLAQPVQ